MGRSSKASTASLYEVAAQQLGFFTTRQALAAGYADNVHPYHVQNGDWRRMMRGIYRLERFPESPHSELMIIWLWSQNRAGIEQAVFSHKTALFLLGEEPWPEGLVQVTLPIHFRRKAGDLPVQLHTEIIPVQERQQVGRFHVTTLEKTLRDLGQSVSPEALAMPPRPMSALQPATAAEGEDWAAWS